MIYGYARVSTNHQDTELQRLALELAGCEHIAEEHASGRKSNRPVLKRLIATMQPGDELVVWKAGQDRTQRPACVADVSATTGKGYQLPQYY